MFGKFHFQGQKPGEEILLVLHRHWFDILSQIFLVLGMIAGLILSFFYLPFFFPNIETAFGSKLFSFVEVSLAMLIWLVLFIIWIDYYFDVWIITNRRIVNIEQKALFVRQVSELEIENIQDVTTEVKGVIPTFLNYGDVFVQTAAEKERFLFHNVPDPYGVKDLMMNLQKRIEKEEARDLGEMIRERIRES